MSASSMHLTLGTTQNDGSFLSMATCENDAKTLIARSPLKYTLSAGDTDDSYPARTTVETPPPGTESRNKTNEDSSLKEFVIEIFPKRAFKNLGALVDSHPLQGPWPKNPDSTSFIAKMLRRSITDPTLRGLTDWETGGQLLEDYNGHHNLGVGVRGGDKQRNMKKYPSSSVRQGMGHRETPINEGERHIQKGRGEHNMKKSAPYYVQRRMDRREARERWTEAAGSINLDDSG